MTIVRIYVASFNAAHVVQTFMREIYGIDLSQNHILTPDVSDFYRDKAMSIHSISDWYYRKTGRTPRIVFFDDDKNNISAVENLKKKSGRSHLIQAKHVLHCGLTPEFFHKHLAESLIFFRNQGHEGDVILVFDFDCTLTNWHVANLQQIGRRRTNKQRRRVVAEHSAMAQILKGILEHTQKQHDLRR